MSFRRFGTDDGLVPAVDPKKIGMSAADSSFQEQYLEVDPKFQEDQLEKEVAEVVEVLKEEASHLEPWLAEALEEVSAIMHERGSKYGPGNIAEFGELGVLVRLSDKLARLRYASGKDFADEAARDAWMDIIGYGLIGLAWADGNWPGSEKAEPKKRECGPMVSGKCMVCNTNHR